MSARAKTPEDTTWSWNDREGVNRRGWSPGNQFRFTGVRSGERHLRSLFLRQSSFGQGRAPVDTLELQWDRPLMLDAEFRYEDHRSSGWVSLSRLALLIATLTAVTLLTACSPETPRTEFREVDVPSEHASGEPNLTVGADGSVYLSWVETLEVGHRLVFSTWFESAWSVPRVIASGSDWFVNWADFPSMAVHRDGTLAAHWLEKVGKGTYAYGVRIVLSHDGGRTWSSPVSPHRDGTETEHGFVSMVPVDEGFLVAWLDGREMADGGEGPMTLRSTVIALDGELGPERIVDSRVCDCCGTDAVQLGDGAVLLAYRNRSTEEIRDIWAARSDGGPWSEPGVVHDDSWKIAGCPVNGPALAADGTQVSCAWFTLGHAEKPQVQVAFSKDGRTFAPATRVDRGDPLGRCDLILLEDGSALVSWIEADGDSADICLRRISASGELTEEIEVVARTSASRASGFPILARSRSQVFLAWTDAGPPAEVKSTVLF